MQARAEIILKGKVQMVVFRTFIKNSADSLNIKGFAENLPEGTVKIVCEGENAKITDFISYIKQESPSFAAIDDINVVYGPYKGEFSSFKRQGADVPSEDGAVLAVLKSFDAKAEKMVTILGSMNEKLGSIDERRDKTIEILKDVKEDTKYIPGIKDDTSKLLGKQDKAMEILDSVPNSKMYSRGINHNVK